MNNRLKNSSIRILVDKRLALRSAIVAAVLTGGVIAGITATVAPAASADVCGGVGGRHVDVGGCTPGIAGAAIDGAVAGAGRTGS